ncbi:MAG: hypothetical protein TQ35_0008700 [Candidatus Aramenus sulfurataquae]|jgi:hypothetical protein|uniref:Uncharacterized protein n=1 Tax=Candidatus Aramenus sulfurataquae TaxID=1326980 RepID=A0ACC6TQW8_9CREN
MLVRYFGGTQYYSPREDIDVVVVKGRKRLWAFEVKLGEISRAEAVEAVKRMSKVAEKVGLVSLEERPEEVGDISLGPKELLEMAGRCGEGRERKSLSFLNLKAHSLEEGRRRWGRKWGKKVGLTAKDVHAIPLESSSRERDSDSRRR